MQLMQITTSMLLTQRKMCTCLMHQSSGQLNALALISAVLLSQHYTVQAC